MRVCLAWLMALLTVWPTACGADAATPKESFVKAVWVPYMEMEALYAAGDAEAVKAAVDARLCRAADEGFNTVYVHVRANSDAYYDSAVFAPTKSTQALLSAGVDPFAVFVEVGHTYGLQVHAWVNPYRIGTEKAHAKAQDVFEADGRFYYVPSSEAVRRLVVAGVRELVERYAVDGVQFDDYFYPEGAVDADTPTAFEVDAFAQAAGTLGDFRRAQVSALVSSVRAVCEAGGCVFGVSPSYDLTRNREALYADTTLWATTAGYVDYLCPQLYVGFEHETAPFGNALAAWSALKAVPSVAFVGGLARYKTGLFEDGYAGVGRAEWAAGGDILARQIEAVSAAKWDGVALYGDDVAGDERDAAVVRQEAQAMKEALLKNRAIDSRRTANRVV